MKLQSVDSSQVPSTFQRVSLSHWIRYPAQRRDCRIHLRLRQVHSEKGEKGEYTQRPQTLRRTFSQKQVVDVTGASVNEAVGVGEPIAGEGFGREGLRRVRLGDRVFRVSQGSAGAVSYSTTSCSSDIAYSLAA